MDRKIGKRIMILSRHYQADVNHLLKNSEFTYAQFNVLRVLKDHDGMGQEELVHTLLIDKARISRVVHQLEEKKLLIKKTCELDKRGVRLFISEEGKKKLPEVERIVKKSGERMLSGIDDSTIENILSVLDHMCKNIKERGVIDE